MKLKSSQAIIFECCNKKWMESGDAATFDRERGCFRSQCPRCGSKVFSDRITVKKAGGRVQARK